MTPQTEPKKAPPAPALSAPLRMNVAEAARILGVSRAQLYRHLKSGALHATKDGSRTLFTMRDLRAFIERDGVAS